MKLFGYAFGLVIGYLPAAFAGAFYQVLVRAFISGRKLTDKEMDAGF